MKKTIQFGAAALVLMMTAAAGAQDKPAPAAQDKPAPAAQDKPRPPATETAGPAEDSARALPLPRREEAQQRAVSAVGHLERSADQPSDGRENPGVFRRGRGLVQLPGCRHQHRLQRASTGPDGMYKVNLTVNDSSIYFPDPARPNAGIPPPANDTTPPAFRSFTSTFSILLRDGQTGQYTSATDRSSGEVLKIDATLNVLK